MNFAGLVKVEAIHWCQKVLGRVWVNLLGVDM
jgi:hypothetical protein